MATTAQHETPSTLAPIPEVIRHNQVPEYFPHLYTENSWLWAYKNRKTNGLMPCIHKVGKKVFVNTKLFIECLSSEVA